LKYTVGYIIYKGGDKWGKYSLGRRPWGCINTLCSHLKIRFKRNLDQDMLENALFFLEKWRNRRSVGGSAPNLCWPPAAGSSASRPPRCYFRHLF